MKTTFNFKLWFLHSMDKYKHGNKETRSIHSFSLITCKLIIWKKLDGKQNLKIWKSSSLCWPLYVFIRVFGMALQNTFSLMETRLHICLKTMKNVRISVYRTWQIFYFKLSESVLSHTTQIMLLPKRIEYILEWNRL